MSSDWLWMPVEVAIAIHREQIAAHGGGDGVRDLGLLESALAKPLNLAACAEPDMAALAASYLFGIARNHPFVDGNKRTAAVVAETFLELNGYRLGADDAELVVAVLAVAAGDMDEDALADWIRGWLSAA